MCTTDDAEDVAAQPKGAKAKGKAKPAKGPSKAAAAGTSSIMGFFGKK